MKKPLSSSILIITLSFTMLQTALASDIAVKLTGQKEGWVHTSVIRDGVELFPVGQILNFLNPSGTETVNYKEKPIYSWITFQGQCFKITHDKTTVQEYEVDESGVCINATGHTYQLEKPARYLDDPTLGVYVPLNFISDILANAPYDNKFDTKYADGTLEFTMYTEEVASGLKQPTNPVKLAMKINSPWLLTEDDGKNFDNNDHNVTPIIRGGNTLLPIAPIIEMGLLHGLAAKEK